MSTQPQLSRNASARDLPPAPLAAEDPRPSGLIEVRHARYGRGLGRSGAALQSSRENLDQVASLRDRARPRWVARLRYGAARHGSRGGLGAKRG